jgi:hypothetical protein
LFDKNARVNLVFETHWNESIIVLWIQKRYSREKNGTSFFLCLEPLENIPLVHYDTVLKNIYKRYNQQKNCRFSNVNLKFDNEPI